jgi:hypothetical protein
MPNSSWVPKLFVLLLGVDPDWCRVPAIARTCDPRLPRASQVCGPAPDCFDSGALARRRWLPERCPHLSDLSFFGRPAGRWTSARWRPAHVRATLITCRQGGGTIGVFTDCATAGGYSGPGSLHIPIHRPAPAPLTYTPGGYEPPPPPSPPSRANLRIHVPPGPPAPVSRLATIRTPMGRSGDIDTTVGRVRPHPGSHGVPVQSQLSAVAGDPGPGVAAAGILSGMRSTLAGTLQPVSSRPCGSPLARRNAPGQF